MTSLSPDPLDIIIVGAGIAGLSAGIALRRVGHRVKIYERSDLKNELGAAIHLSPNASRELLDWGVDAKGARFVEAKCTYIANGKTLDHVYENDYSTIEQIYGAPWYLAHRIDLHNELKRIAARPDAPGQPVTIIPHARVIAYDPIAGLVTFEDLTTDKADVLVGADGIHSLATEVVLGSPQPATPTDQSAFRFLIPSSKITSDPETAFFLEGDDGRFKIFTGEGKRIVWYPCRNNEEQNFVCIFHEQATEQREDWNNSTELKYLLDEFRDLHPTLLAVCRKATNIKKWPLLFRNPISTWHKARLVLVGDAAHPMLPHQGQAGAQAVEDSVALGTMLSKLTKTEAQRNPEIISKMLEMYEQVRRRRASAMQILSNVGQDQSEKVTEKARQYVDGHIPRNPAEFIVFNFTYNIREHSQEVFRNA